MADFILAIYSQALLFLPLALGINISFNFLKATDMTLDGSFVLGAATFALCTLQGVSPLLALMLAMLSGACAGLLTAIIQRDGRIDPLLAGILSLFILTSFNLIFMGRPNISLLNANTLFSSYFNQSAFLGWTMMTVYVIAIGSLIVALLKSRQGLILRALGDNPGLLKRMAYPVETYRLLGFGLTNALAALSGSLTAQVVGFADISMGLGVTLTGIGTLILGQQIVARYTHGRYFRIGLELCGVILGIICYFSLMNLLLRLDINPIYLKMIIGVLLVIFLRTMQSSAKGLQV